MKKARRATRKISEPPQAAGVSDSLPIESWRETLTHFSRATGLTLALFDPAGALRVGPLSANPLGEALAAGGAWREPDGVCFASAREVTQRCIAQSASAQTTICDVLTAVAIPIREPQRAVGAIAAGWVFTNFPEPVSTDRFARLLGLSFPETWQIVRQVSPMSTDKLALYADLLQMVADFFMKHRVETDEKFGLIDSLKEQQAELKRAARARDELFAVVSHELRTPLTPILGWLPIIREEIEQGHLEQVREGLDAIERNARQEVHLIDEMLDLSRILTGRIVFSPEPVVPASILAQAASAARSVLGARALGIHTDIEERLPAVWVDRQRLLQVLANLVSNAVKFTPDGGLITLGARAGAGVVEFFVADTGIGVAPEAAAVIFDRFQQADSGIQRRYGGLGIGLSVVKNLIDMQGGQVRVESPGNNNGAAFVITLPASEAPAVPAVAPPPSPLLNPEALEVLKARRRAFKVLIVDDVADTLDLMQRLLARAGYQVATASSASGAVAAARSQPPDALISDISMPDGDGLELLRQLRAEASLGKLPAIAVSGFTGEAERGAARQSGFNAYFTKPLDVSALLKTLDHLLLSTKTRNLDQTAKARREFVPLASAAS
jgi:signal transduction histidine kinase/ActR/RegA family two-component response regulator